MGDGQMRDGQMGHDSQQQEAPPSVDSVEESDTSASAKPPKRARKTLHHLGTVEEVPKFNHKLVVEPVVPPPLNPLSNLDGLSPTTPPSVSS